MEKEKETPQFHRRESLNVAGWDVSREDSRWARASLQNAVDKFRGVLADFCGEAGGKTTEDIEQQSDIFIQECFEKAWSRADYDATWQELRGDLGECVGHWLSIARSTSEDVDEIETAYRARLAKAILHKAPQLLDVGFTTNEFQGQTWLMQVAANGDEVMLEEILKHTNLSHLNAVSTGAFLRQRTRGPVDIVPNFDGVSVLEIATVAPKDDDVACRIVARLMDAGADPMKCCSASEGVQYSLLQFLACCRWDGEGKIWTQNAGALLKGLHHSPSQVPSQSPVQEACPEGYSRDPEIHSKGDGHKGRPR